MTTEIAAAGYTDIAIGTIIDTNWNYCEFQTSAGVKIIRIKINGSGPDSRVTRTALDAKHATYSVVLHGNDTDIAAAGLPKVFGKAVFKKLDTDGATVMGTDTFTDATLAVAGDSLTVNVGAGVLT
jgi:hypothetical protein